MAKRRNEFRMDHPVVVTFLIIAIVASMALAAEVLKPLALAILLSFALAPLTRFLERRGLPRVLSVVLTVVLALGALGGIGYAVEKQLTALANELPRYQGNIEGKLQRLIKPHQETALTKANKVAQDVAAQLSEPPVKVRPREVQNVRIVEEPSFRERLQAAVGPYLEFLSIGFFVLILVLFILLNREDLADRIIRLFGNRQISLTTRTMSEVGQRVSRYLATFALVNSMFGLIVGLGLAAFGIEYAMLWGFLAAVLRFIPYVGPATAFALPLLFSVARYDTWRQPLEVLALFGVLEVMANSFLEPIIYGKSTGVSALGLLVAAMFWTWLWGALGLLLSTPLTVCLAVLGKYVPSLSVFAVILGEEPALEPEVKFYQRLLALDEDGANAIIEAELKKRPRVEVFDEVLIPTLSRAERDRAREEIDERDQAFVLRVVGDILDDLEGTSELSLDALAPTAQGEAGGAVEARVLGVASNDQADALALRMLALALAPSGCTLEVLTETESPLQLSEAVAGRAPTLVVLSHLPPLGLTPARYLVRRLRARLPQLPILVGRWGEGGDPAEVAERLTAVGASRVVFTLAEARDQVLAAVLPKPQETQATALQPF